MRVGLLAGCLLCLSVSVAFAANEAAIVSVGPLKLTAEDLIRRLSRVPAFQLEHYGPNPQAARKAYVDQAMVPELLFAAEAGERKLADRPELKPKVRDVLKDAMERALREEVAAKQPVKQEDISAYFDEHRSRFETPARIRIWRILVADEAAARTIIEQAKGTEGPKRWSELSRAQSLDKATALRNGDLGFVRPDGSTDAPRVKVDPTLVAAAAKVADGAVVAEPVKEGDRFAVVWRRGSMPEAKRTIAQETPSIRQLLERRRGEDALRELVKALRQEHVKESHPELLEAIDTAAFGEPPKRNPASSSSGKRVRPPAKTKPRDP